MATRRRSGRTRDPAEVREFIEQFAETGVVAGMPRMPSRAFAALLSAETGSMTAAELAEDLEVSPAAVSGAVRYLTQVGLAVRRRPIGTRRDEFEATSSWYTLVTERDQILDRWVEQIHAGVRAVGPDTPAGERLAETADFFAFLREEMAGVLERWRSRPDR